MSLSKDQTEIPTATVPQERAFIWIFCLCAVVLPLIFGELFPFSAAPMFRDHPQVYCQYRVLDPNGDALELEVFELQRNYDGNPPGMGAGVTPLPTLDRFGTAPDMDVVTAHVQRRLRAMRPDLPFVDVEQTVIGALDKDRVGIVRSMTARVSRDAP